MFSQLECLGDVLAGPHVFAERVVVAAHYVIARGKIRIKLDGMLKVRQGRGSAFSLKALLPRLYAFRASSEDVVASSTEHRISAL